MQAIVDLLCAPLIEKSLPRLMFRKRPQRLRFTFHWCRLLAALQQYPTFFPIPHEMFSGLRIPAFSNVGSSLSVIMGDFWTPDRGVGSQ